MGIRTSERTEFFHVPYGPLNNEGTPETSFVDLKTKPEWIPVLPPCIGWPETQHLLQTINAPASQLQSLATDQAFVDQEQSKQKATLTSFVTICFAEIPANTKSAISKLAGFLNTRVDQELQETSNTLQQPLNLDLLIELQPTMFHHHNVQGWSLRIFIASFGIDREEARHMWKLCMKTLETVIKEW